jgi:CheY-like chemotaxis protein
LLYARVVLEAAGTIAQVLSFETAIAALDFLATPEADAVDAILLDINMPEMSGFEFLDAYETLHDDRPAPAVIVMLSSSPHPADQARAMAHRCVRGYLVKPIDLAGARGLAGLVAPRDGRD